MATVFIPPALPVYPKWVQPHASLVVTQKDRKIVPLYPSHATDRVTGTVSVIVKNAADEAAATLQPISSI